MDTPSHKRKRTFSPCPGDNELYNVTLGINSHTPEATHAHHHHNHHHHPTAHMNNGIIKCHSKIDSLKFNNSHIIDDKAPNIPRTKRARSSTSAKSNKGDALKSATKTGEPKKRGRKPHNGDNDGEYDVTRSLPDPPDDVNLREVVVPKAAPNVKQHELAPVRGGTVLDLDLEQALYYDDNEPVSDDQQHAIDQTNYIIVPSFTSWFDYNSIHTIERKALPEFFCKSSSIHNKTPEVFITYRNSIIDTYRLNPLEYLSVTTCRRTLTGDICTIMRVHAFLERWGLINYQIEPESRPLPVGPPHHFHVISDTRSGFKPVGPDGRAQNGRPSHSANIQMFNRDNREPEVVEEDEEARLARAKTVGLRLDDYSVLNYLFQTRGAATVSREWTEAETASLLEAIELYKDDWHKVCEHVKGRSQDECILHFLRLPIEDPFLVEDETTGPAIDYQPIPFSSSANPIMSTIAFLTSVVDPRVAAAAAKAALQNFSKLADDDTTKDKSIDGQHLSSATASALSAATAKAKQLANVEERKIKSLVTVLVDTQLKKLDIKMKHFEELDSIVEKERETIENQRKQLINEQQEFETEQVRAANFRAGQIEVQNMINPDPPSGSTPR